MAPGACTYCEGPVVVEGDEITCNQCKLTFHPKCMRISGKIFKKMSGETKSKWKCVVCHAVGKAAKSTKNDASNPTPECALVGGGDDLGKIRESIAEINRKLGKLDNIGNKLDGFEKSVQYCSDQADTQKKQLEDLLAEVRLLRTENEKLKSDNNQLAIQIKQQACDLNALDQYGRRNNMEIHGIPQTNDESTDEIVFSVCKAFNMQISHVDLEASHRLNTNGNGPKPIIARFVNRRLKEELMRRRRITKNFNAKQVNQAFPADVPVYLNDNLTATNRRLLGFTKAKRQEAGLKFVWFSRDSVFVRRDENAPALRISEEGDILRLLPQRDDSGTVNSNQRSAAFHRRSSGGEENGDRMPSR